MAAAKRRRGLQSGTHWRVLGTLLAAARERAGLTQADVAQRLGERPAWVARLEAGRRTDVVELMLVAQAIGVDAVMLVERWRRIPRHRGRHERKARRHQ